MIQLPDYLKPYRKQALEIIEADLVGEIDFSGPTYQVQVLDPVSKKDVWAFLQLDKRGKLIDSFCSCEGESDEQQYCPHLAAAYLRIFNDHTKPLHERFSNSFWNQLFHIYSDLLGDNPDILKKNSFGQFTYKSKSKTLFSIRGLTPNAKNFLNKTLEERKKQTETTSLKFSNLSEEDLALWQAGTPGSKLKYNLSFWNDLAQWTMLLQENKQPYKIDFKFAKNSIPNEVQITFNEIELSFHLTEKNLIDLIPSLSTVTSPLKVYQNSKDDIKSITYDKKKETLIVAAENSSESTSNNPIPHSGIILDGWSYVPNDGFYSNLPHELLQATPISGPNISYFLTKYTSLIRSHLINDTIHTEYLTIQYTLHFDKKWDLHIKGYIFTPGDLDSPNAHYYEDWVYLDSKGFYPLVRSRFNDLEIVIPSSEVGDFVYRERNWLNSHEGFHTHLSSIETQLTYKLTDDNYLSFQKLLSLKKPNADSKDFGVWVYIANHGFYPKGSAYTTLPTKPHSNIHPNQIPFFIHDNLNELQMVSGFFSKTNPILKTGIKIELTSTGAINITPEYELHKEYQGKDVRFFEDFVYVAEEGFHHLPVSMRLPEQYRHFIHIVPKNVPQFINSEFAKALPYASNVDQRLIQPVSLVLEAASISKTKVDDTDWYALDLHYKSERGIVPVPLIWNALKQKKKYLFHSAGCLSLSDKRYDWIKRLPKEQLDKESKMILLSTLELIRLHAFEEFGISPTAPDAEKSTLLLKELLEFQLPEMPNLTGMHGTLRPYQKLGVHWLWFLYRHNLSGLLCDEMGLGKTHQAMALLSAIVNAHQTENWKHHPHFLVICPTSVIYHWKEKLEEYFPDLRICTYYGLNRSMEEFHKEYDLLLTSYGIWRLEHEELCKIPFEVAIYDEIQIAKNQNSRIHTSLLATNSKMRVGLTGTPIENYLRELKALFDLVLPSYMPNDKDFREIFIKPIERGDSLVHRNLLKRFTTPFMLRRKKVDVLPDLPEKTEEISHCELSSDQQMLYTQTLHQSRSYLLERLKDPNASVPYMHIFALLSSLKQICNHPAVYLKIPAQYKEFSSGKWDLFVELLSEARESQQKVVVFTQYLFMLDIFKSYLEENNIGYATIRGATTNRGEEIHRFNNDPECEVFLGSLQAAGLGVNLTRGSVVIHYDRWWNAARENQATDRVHRIGQTRGVQVFKLVTKNTFEERIDEIISRKAVLMEEVVATDDHRFMKTFDRNELIDLLEDIEEIKPGSKIED
jgi:SNF2 family DNA or RNA helicase